MDTDHLPGGYHTSDIPAPMDHKRYQDFRGSFGRVKARAVRPAFLGFEFPRSRTGQPAWFAEMKRNAGR